MSDVVIRVENISKLYRLGEVGTGSLAHDVNRWWHRVRGKEDPYLKIGEVNDRTKPAKQASSKKSLTTEDTESTEGAAGVRLAGQAGAAFPNPSTSELASDSENTSLIRAANEPRFSGQRNGSGDDAESQKTENFNLKTENSAPKGSDWVYALKDVSFEVKRGEVLGIIGRNGAGKSTLLKILSRVTTQSSGRIKVKGRIASLLEVGTGFHPELTGRENIFLNGAILGMRKAEIARKFDEIVEFSGCARYIDTPVKRYSSGMYVRLAFAVAAHLEPEILIVDEVLAVGDAEFQKKCLGKMKDVAGHGRTILFVSHNMTAVAELCSRAIYLKNGRIEMNSKVEEVISDYLADDSLGFDSEKDLDAFPRPLDKGKNARLLRIQIFPSNTKILFGGGLELKIAVKVHKNIDNLFLGIGVNSLGGSRLFTIENYEDRLRHISAGEEVDFLLKIPNHCLSPGVYTIDIGLNSGIQLGLDHIPNAIKFEVVGKPNEVFYGSRSNTGVRLPASWQAKIISNKV
jgi:lipopolysaccharide transport system ATP-binding protein